MSLTPYWLRHLRHYGSRNPVARVLYEDPFAVIARDPFFRDPFKFFRHAIEPVEREIQEVYSDNEVKIDGKKIEVALDVKNFNADDIHVKTVGNEILVEGKKELKREGGWTKSHFERRFLLPEGFPPEKVECHFDKGKLLLVAFRAEPVAEKKIPIQDKSSGQESLESAEKAKE